jgi:hypothetical protein
MKNPTSNARSNSSTVGTKSKRSLSRGNRQKHTSMEKVTKPSDDAFLPDGWTRTIDANGKVLYINKTTRKAQMEFPLPKGWRYGENGAFINPEGITFVKTT